MHSSYLEFTRKERQAVSSWGSGGLRVGGFPGQGGIFLVGRKDGGITTGAREVKNWRE